mmetsp:Transcript_15261/g.45331  ORF Transcript_15261/g.45331 Transcript_15261/m.45331 type:complete len:238 (+) Transcript_15261:307-1020(+)
MRDADAAEHALGELGRALRLDEEGEVDGEVPRLIHYFHSPCHYLIRLAARCRAGQNGMPRRRRRPKRCTARRRTAAWPTKRSRGDLAAISPGDLPAISLGYVERLRLYHRDDAPSGGRRVAVDGNLEDAGGGGEGLLELLAEDGGGALVADSLAHDPRARLDAGDDLEAAVPPRVARVRGGEGAQQLVRRPRRRRGEDSKVEDELQHAAATGGDDQRDDKDRGERGGGPLLQRVGRR